MALQDDELDPQGGGFGDWMSGLAPILGAAASFRSPAAGAALFGIGDYMRRQRMAELAAQRQQRTQAIQQQRDLAAREQARGLGYEVPEGTTAVDTYKWIEDQRRREVEDRKLKREERSAQAVGQATGLEGTMFSGLPSEAAAQLQSIVQNVDLPSRAQIGPTQQRITEGQQRERQFQGALPFMPPTTGGQTPEQWKQMQGTFAWGDPRTTNLAQTLERGGFDPTLAGAEGEGFVAERAKRQTVQAQDVLAKAKAQIDAGILSGAIDPHQAMTAYQQIAQGLRQGFAATPSGTELAAQAVGGAPAADVMRFPGGAGKIVQREGEQEGVKGAARIRGETPAELAKAGGLANIQTAAAINQFKQLAPLRQAENLATLRQTADFERGEPLKPDQLTHYVHRVTMTHPPPGSTRADVEKHGYYTPTPKNFTPNGSASVKADYLAMYDLVLSRPDLFPPSTGNVWQDNYNVGLAWTTWKTLANTDKDLGKIAAVRADMVQHAKAAGDTANSAIEEQLRQEGGLAMSPMTRERALGSLEQGRDRVSQAWQGYGLAPIVLAPDKQDAVSKIMADAEIRDKQRRNRGAPPATFQLPTAPPSPGQAPAQPSATGGTPPKRRFNRDTGKMEVVP